MAKKKKIDTDKGLNNKEVKDQNKDLYGMGLGLYGGEDPEAGELRKKWGAGDSGVGIEEPEYNAGAVGDITDILKKRSRASDAPQALIPWRGDDKEIAGRDESILSIVQSFGESLINAPESVKDLCVELLLDIRDKKRFETIRNYTESLGLTGLPTWEEAEAYNKDLDENMMPNTGGLGSGTSWSIYPWDRPGNFTAGGVSQRREVPGIIEFSMPLPSPKAPKIDIPNLEQSRVNSRNARKGVHSRMARARSQITQAGRNNSGRENRAHYLGAGEVRPRNTKESFKQATGKYEDISDSKIKMKEGVPTISGKPWFHGTVSKRYIGGVPCIHIAEGHILCSGNLPRPKMTEGYYVWDIERNFADYDMEVTFAQLSEGMTSERDWLRKSGKDFVLGLPTEGVIVECRGGNLSFLTFDSQSGKESARDWMVERAAEVGNRQAVLETVTYGYVRAGQSDLILDRVIRKLNRLNMLDILEDAVFDKGAEALYVLLNPTLEENDVQAVAAGIQQDYPEVQILGGPLDENVDWWVLYIPKPGSEYGPELQNIFAPQISKPLDVPSRDLVNQAIRQVIQ